MLLLQKIIQDILAIIASGVLIFQSAGQAIPTPINPIEEVSNSESEIYDPVITAYEKTLTQVVEEAQAEIDEARRIEEENQRIEQDRIAAENTRIEQEGLAQEQTQLQQQQIQPQQQTLSERTPQQTQSQPSLNQYVTLNGTYYGFKDLPLDTQTAQNFIDANPDQYGYWRNVSYATTFDILFAHYYAAGKLVFDANVGSTITLKFADGSTKNYRVQAKTIQPIDAYYDSNSNLWKEVGLNFDLMIKTCYEVNVTDIIITLVEI